MIRTSMRRRATLAALAAAAAAAAAAPAVAAAQAAPPELTAMYFRPIAPPQPVLGADGRIHLAYELQAVNQSSLYVTIAEIAATRPGGGAPLQRLRGPGLGAVMGINGGKAKPGSRTLAPGGSGAIFLDATLRRGARVPAALVHRIRLVQAARPGGPPPPGTARSARFTGVRVPVERRPAVLVQPPLRGPNWVVGNGCCSVLNAHRGATLAIDGTAYAAERFAIDFVQLAPNGRLWNGPADLNSSFAYFGDPIHAAAPGRVVRIQDGRPEQVPGRLPEGQTVETAGGNYVVVDIGGGRFAFYAHMQPGSLRVKAGDRVAAGQVIGLLGNTGNTDAAHLHFHVMDGPSPLTSNGVPFRFTSFAGQGVVADEAALVSGAVTPVDGARLAGPRSGALPLNLQVIDFGP
jgi:hypothetical protein